MRSTWLVIGVPGLVALLMGGCGGSSSAAAMPQAFLEEVDHVCSSYYHAAYSLPPPIGTKQLLALPAKQQALRETELMELKRLKAPASARSRYEEYLAAMGTVYRLEGLVTASISKGPSPSSETKLRIGHLQASLYAKAAVLGLSECAKDPFTATHTFTG